MQFPEHTKYINATLGLFSRDDYVYYLHNGSPIYCHEKDVRWLCVQVHRTITPVSIIFNNILIFLFFLHQQYYQNNETIPVAAQIK